MGGRCCCSLRTEAGPFPVEVGTSADTGIQHWELAATYIQGLQDSSMGGLWGETYISSNASMSLILNVLSVNLLIYPFINFAE